VTTPEAEWRALEIATRDVAMQYARDYKPHPDPAVSAIALRYARWYLDARTRRGRRQYLAIAVIVAAAVVLGWFSGGPAAGRAPGKRTLSGWRRPWSRQRS
jgi:hypothetical protein